MFWREVRVRIAPSKPALDPSVRGIEIYVASFWHVVAVYLSFD